MSRLSFPVFSILAALAVVSPVSAHDYTLGDLKIVHPWARVSAVQNGAAYMTITAQGGAGDRLVAAASPAANRAELHTHIMDGNVMRMRQVQGIDVKPGETATLKPGGLHVMLLGLKQPLVDGQSFPLTLTFEKGGRIDVEVKVQKDENSGEHGTAPNASTQHNHAPASRPHGAH